MRKLEIGCGPLLVHICCQAWFVWCVPFFFFIKKGNPVPNTE